MQDRINDLTDLNSLDLVVPKDGALAVIANGSRFWAPPPAGHEPESRSDGEHWLPLLYEPVLSHDGKIIDVVAWEENDHSRWWVLTGHGVVLGEEELCRVYWTHLPMYLVSTPAGWRHLQRSPQQTQSVCLLDWNTCQTTELFRTVWGPVICASESLRRRFEGHHKACGGEPLNLSVDDQL